MNKLEHRLEFRMDAELCRQLTDYCKKGDLKQSDVARDAIKNYIEVGSFKQLVLELLESQGDFREVLKDFISKAPMGIALFFENFLGPTEVEMADKLPAVQEFESLFITDKGKRAFRSKYAQGEI